MRLPSNSDPAPERDKLAVPDVAVASATTPRYSRRLSDKILVAFHHACDQADFEVAEQLLQVLELMLTRRPVHHDLGRRRNMESLVAAHERLWYLRHPTDDANSTLTFS